MKRIQKLIFVLAITMPFSAFANISITDKFAWGEQIGWVNFNPTGGSVVVSGTGVIGQAWSSNYGWIYLNPTNGGVTLTNSIISSSCQSTLSGAAWSPNLGWIDFAGVKIDANGKFYGNATGVNAGNISFSGATHHVATSLLPSCGQVDTDGDGVSDNQEISDGTDPNSGTNFLDTDNDGIPNSIDPNPYSPGDTLTDSDGDGVPNAVEAMQGTDANIGGDFRDTDGDGVPDYVEAQQGTDSNDGDDFIDTDGDGASDYSETNATPATNLNDSTSFPDTDGDGITDSLDPNPTVGGDTLPDTDGDGVPDVVEQAQGTNSGVASSYKDSDGDGVPDYVEAGQGTNAQDSTSFLDTDNDGITDSLDPNPTVGGDTLPDTDEDGVPDVIETAQGTNPNNGSDFADSDGDGVSDYSETKGFNAGDGDGDGILDKDQRNVSGVNNPVTGKPTTLKLEGQCTLITENKIVSESSLATNDALADYPVGLADFSVNCTAPGDSTNVTIYYDKVYDTNNWKYKKYDSTGNAYSDISSIATYGTAIVGSHTVTTVSFTVTDGDPNTDEDGAMNGVIQDPSGPAVSSRTGSSGGSPSYDRCEGEDTSGSIYDGKCGEEDTAEQSDVPKESEEENIQVEESVPKSSVKGEDYEVENDFTHCSVVRNIQNPDYKYKTNNVFLDEDVSQHKKEILKFAEIGVVNGYSDGTFGPLNTMTRAEFLKVALITHCYDYSKQDPSGLEYVDVDISNWQAKIISKAQDLGMINGSSLQFDKNLIDTNLGKGYNPERITELKRVLKNIGLYEGKVNGYYSNDLVDAIYSFQVSQGIVTSEYAAGAGSWGPATRKRFFELYKPDVTRIFKPNDIITKAEATKILFKFSLIEAINPVKLGYDDVIVDWHKKYIRTGETVGLFNASKDNKKFYPSAGVTRENMIDLINRLIQLYK